MSIFDSIGSFVGSAVGNAILPGIGGIIGEELGKVAGGLAGQVFDQFAKDPIGTLSDPMSLPSKFVDNALGQLGAPKEFRSLVKFATDPQSAIRDILAGRDRCEMRPVSTGGRCCNDQGLTTNGKDTVDTGRYLISAHEGEVKIYDKQTNTWVQAQGDPHLSTSDGDHGQFQKNLTIDLPDGTEVKIKTTPQDCNGVSYIDKVAVMKGQEAVVMSGFHDGQPGVNVGHVLNNSDAVAGQWSDGTVLRAGRNVSDLTYASNGKEIIGGDANGKWGEWALDNHGGVSRYHNGDDTCGNGLPHLPHFPFPIPLPHLPHLPIGGGSNGGSNGGGDSVSASTGGSSILAVLMQLARKERNELFDKVNQLKNLKVPGKDASPQEQADFESQRDELKASIQSLQSEVQTVVTMATNLEKNEHDTEMSVARNLA